MGKSTTLGILEGLGHPVVQESAREVIKRESVKENGVLPWTNLYEFQRLVLALQLEREAKAPVGAFCDRGVLDGRAYCRLGNIELPCELKNVVHGYAKVFLLSPLENFIQDEQRLEDVILGRRLHEEIERVYCEAGYDLVRVPLLPASERVNFILDCVR